MVTRLYVSKSWFYKLFFGFFLVLFHSIPRILTLIPRIPILIPRVSTIFPHVPITPLIPFPDSPFRLLQIAFNKDSTTEIENCQQT